MKTQTLLIILFFILFTLSMHASAKVKVADEWLVVSLVKPLTPRIPSLVVYLVDAL